MLVSMLSALAISSVICIIVYVLAQRRESKKQIISVVTPPGDISGVDISACEKFMNERSTSKLLVLLMDNEASEVAKMAIEFELLVRIDEGIVSPADRLLIRRHFDFQPEEKS